MQKKNEDFFCKWVSLQYIIFLSGHESFFLPFIHARKKGSNFHCYLFCFQKESERWSAMKILFFIPGKIPTCTAQERKIVWSRKMTYLPEEVKQAKRKYYSASIEYAPSSPIDEACEVEFNFHFYQKNGKAGHYKATKPDCDNLAKLLTDSLAEAGFFEDDSRICRLIVTKDFVDEDKQGIDVMIKTLGDRDDDCN